MAKLVVNPTSSSKREVSLSHTLLSIGRDPSNDVVLPDAMVSRRHAVIEYRGNQYYLRDCNSSNGSLVNGDKVSERGLRDGDLLAIGTARLLFREDLEVESGAKVVHHPSAPRLACPACGADHRQGDHFCRQCGTALSPVPPSKAVCISCGTAVPLPAHFCTACGTALPVSGLEPSAASKPKPEPPVPGPDPGPAPRPEPPVDEEPAPPPVEARGPAGVPRPNPGAHAAANPARVIEPAVAPASPASSWPPASGPASAAAAVEKPLFLRRAPAVSHPASWPETAPRTASAESAGLGRRFLAASADAVLVGVGQLMVMSPALLYWSLRDSTNAPSFLAVLLSLTLVPLALGSAALYYIYFWGVAGATPGKRFLGLMVETEDGTQPIGTVRAAIRLFGYLLSGALLGVGFLMALSGGRALHDRLAGTRVVRRA